MEPESFQTLKRKTRKAYRLINSRFPPTSLFDDVADADQFEAVYAVQLLTNPRILNEVGDLNMLPRVEIPFGIDGCNYATAPFTHVNPNGSRFSDGSYGVLYLADEMDTAIEETVYHQENYFRNVEGLHYDVIIMRGLMFRFSSQALDIKSAPKKVYHPDDYSHARSFGRKARLRGIEALEYFSVRRSGSVCWALFTPRYVKSAKQTQHYEYVWNGACIESVNAITRVR